MSQRSQAIVACAWLGLVAIIAALSMPLTAITPSAIAAEQSCPKTTLTDIEDEVMCPVCGTSLAAVQNAPQAKRERAFIADEIKRCRSKEQIKKALVAEFGPEILALPEKRGFDITAWLVPALALLFAVIAIAAALFFWIRNGPADAESVPTTPLSKADSERVDDEISRLDP